MKAKATCRHSSGSSEDAPCGSLDSFCIGEKSEYILDDRFELLHGLGDCRTTKVYVARNILNSETVVIKYDTGRLKREYDTLSALTHDRIIEC